MISTSSANVEPGQYALTLPPVSLADLDHPLPNRLLHLARSMPQHPAVRGPHTTLTYAALVDAAYRIAGSLLLQPASDAACVALLMAHDAPVMAALFGVLLAGKMYVPLDPGAPTERLRFILEDAGARVVLTDEAHKLLAHTLAPVGCQVLGITEALATVPASLPALTSAPDSLACLLYTSGSTGQPKGVIHTHRTLLHEAWKTAQCVSTRPGDRQTLLRSVSFNGAQRDIYGSLLHGATLCLFDLESQGFARLPAWLRHEAITIYRSVTSVFRHFASLLPEDAAPFPALRTIHIGGEPVTARDVALFQRFFADTCVLYNGLGLTETGTVCMYAIDKTTRLSAALAPVGQVMQGMEVLLWDDHGEPITDETVGEIVVKSPVVSRGYWRRPELTQAAFVPDPADTTARLYRTGDLGRWDAHGHLVHLGRKDRQVKVRGQRVEIAEIEIILQQLESVQEVAVVAQDEAAGMSRLLAYVVPHPGRAPTVTALRQALALHLPAAMMPSVFVFLEALPRLSGGKIDHHALPPPGHQRPPLEVPYLAPRTELEVELAGIWSAVLGVEQVGVHDAFLDLGGHSLLATQIVNRVLERWQVALPLQTLLEAPTVAGMTLTLTHSLTGQVSIPDLQHWLAEAEGAPSPLSDRQESRQDA